MKKLFCIIVISLMLICTLTSCDFFTNLFNNYTITYSTGGMVDVKSAKYKKGEIPAIPDTPIVDGYVFFGWYTDETCTDRYFFDYAFEEDVTLYAKFYDTSLGEYIVISNVEQLMAIKDAPEAKYLLACDINCKGETLIPIDAFSGELEGNGYKIFNFSMNETTNVCGFVCTNKGSIANLSFKDFTFNILVNTTGQTSYGIITATNEGTITNCHVLDSNIKINITADSGDGGGNSYSYIGTIAGRNYGSVIKCSNNASANVEAAVYRGFYVYNSNTFSLNLLHGGIIGSNEKEATMVECDNTGNINTTIKAHGVQSSGHNKNGCIYYYCGGIVGNNAGNVDASKNAADITTNTEFLTTSARGIYSNTGSAIGNNDGTVNNSYATGKITYNGDITELRIGGFVGVNKGKTYNCYTTSNIICETCIVTSAGGFAAENNLVSGYPALINKCFSTGNITFSVVPTDSDYFVGKTTGTAKDCYYLDTMTMNVVTKAEGEGVETIEPITPACTIGEAKTIGDFTSVNFIENTLYFDRMIWFVYEGKLPTLR